MCIVHAPRQLSHAGCELNCFSSDLSVLHTWRAYTLTSKRNSTRDMKCFRNHILVYQHKEWLENCQIGKSRVLLPLSRVILLCIVFVKCAVYSSVRLVDQTAWKRHLYASCRKIEWCRIYIWKVGYFSLHIWSTHRVVAFGGYWSFILTYSRGIKDKTSEIY